jgi:hypothetical protein
MHEIQGVVMSEVRREKVDTASLALLKRQRSHVLFVLSNAKAGGDEVFRSWLQGGYRREVSDIECVLSAQHYEQHRVDITGGHFVRPQFHYLGLYGLSIDGAEAAERLIERIATLYGEQPAADPPATWLYYPVSEKVGRPAVTFPSMLTVAFANGIDGQEAEFREWYATRHIRHALNIPALVSGQCFERTQFQRPGAMGADFATIAIYEQEGTPDSIIESFRLLPQATFHFPMLDCARFAESVYSPIPAE